MPSRTCSWVNILVAPRTTLLLINQILGLGLHLLKFQSPSISARKTKMKLNILCLLTWTHLIKLYCFESWTLYLFLTALVWMTGHHWLRVQQKLMQTSLLYCPKVRNAKITLCLKSWRTMIMIFLLEVGYLPKRLTFSFRAKEAIWNLYQKWSRNEQVHLVSQKSSVHIKINMAFLKLKQMNIALAMQRSWVRFPWECINMR